MIRGVPLTVWVLRAVVALGPLAALYAPAPEGYVPSVFVALVVLAAGLAFAAYPEAMAGAIVMLVVLVWWTTVVGQALPFASVVAATALLLSHTAATVLSYGPSRALLDRSVLVTWTLRAALVWCAAPVIWLVADAYSGQATPTSFWLLGLLTAVVGALVAALVVPTSGDHR